MKTKIMTQEIEKLDICALLKANNCAGKIGVVYREGDNQTADCIARAIEGGGSLVKRIAYPDDLLVNDGALADLLSLPEDIRFLVAIGDRNVSELVSCCEREYILILNELNTAEYLLPKVMLNGSLDTLESKPPLVVCINRSALSAKSQNLARAYACIIAHYSILPDMWFNSCFSAVNNKYLEGVDKALQRLSLKPVERNSSESVDRIIRANIDLAELNCAASHDDRTIFSSMRLASMDITQELDGVELGALWTTYIYNYLAKLLPQYGENLRFPSDLSELAQILSSQTAIDCGEIMRRMPHVDMQDIITRDYVLIEYKSDISDKIKDRLENISIAIKQLKRLYDDAGLSLTKAIKLVNFKKSLLSSIVVIPMYTLPKHLCLMGIF